MNFLTIRMNQRLEFFFLLAFPIPTFLIKSFFFFGCCCYFNEYSRCSLLELNINEQQWQIFFFAFIFATNLLRQNDLNTLGEKKKQTLKHLTKFPFSLSEFPILCEICRLISSSISCILCGKLHSPTCDI